MKTEIPKLIDISVTNRLVDSYLNDLSTFFANIANQFDFVFSHLLNKYANKVSNAKMRIMKTLSNELIKMLDDSNPKLSNEVLIGVDTTFKLPIANPDKYFENGLSKFEYFM